MFRIPGRVACAAILALLAVRGEGSESPRPLHVLFIGNSLTYVNDLPAIVSALAEASGGQRISCEAVVSGGYDLEDHWQHGDALATIRRGSWNVVVLQQGPSASAEGRASLILWTRRFATEIRKAGGVPALYSVWPPTSRRSEFNDVAASYREAARSVGGRFFPAGQAWQFAWKRDPGLKLYSSDGLHPTPAGSYLAALVVYGRLTGESAVGLPASLNLVGGARLVIPSAEATLLQQAAAEALEKSPDP